MTAPLWRVTLLLLGSGLSALVYQVAWLRELRLVFGGSTGASAAVLAVFMGGLGLGSLWLGKRAGAHPRPLRLYARLELLVALTAAATPLLLSLSRSLYVALGGTVTLGPFLGTAVRLALTALVLGAPTFLMGGTLPAAAQAAQTDGDPGRRRLALLYGANTLGALTGVCLSTFFLLEHLGTRRTLWAAAILNALVALVAGWLSRARSQPTTAGAARIDSGATATAPGAAAAVAAAPASTPSIDGGFAVAAAAITGFAFLLMELVWYRMLGPLLGGSTFTFGLILAAALLGIGLGGIAYGLFFGRRTPTPLGLSLTCALEALFVAAPFAAGDHLALLAGRLRELGSMGFAGYVLGWSAVAALVVLPAAIVSGLQFPLLIALLGKGREDVGRQAGLAYAWNTAGAIAGSLAGGFGLLPLLSAPGAWRLVTLLLVGLAAAALWRARGASLFRKAATLLPALGAALLLLTPGPGAAWRHGGIGAGRAPALTGKNAVEAWLREERRAIVWEVDGVESSVGLRAVLGYSFVVNGKTDGNARNDASMQVMSGLVGALLHPKEVETGLVIGLGTGETAGWLASIPSMKRLDVVELEPAILHVAALCKPVNQDVLNSPKVSIQIGDARETLLTSPRRYDLVFSEPSNPYRAGIASLFTQELYSSVRNRLSPGGIFVQWVQSYEVNALTVQTIYATLGAVFPHVETWAANGADLLLVASEGPIVYDAAKLSGRIAREPFKSALSLVWRSDDLAGLLSRYVGSQKVAGAMARAAGGAINTDDKNLVEFGFARAVAISEKPFQLAELRALAQQNGEGLPALIGKAIPAEVLDERRLTMGAVDWDTPDPLPADAPDAQRARSEALISWLDGDRGAALRSWREQSAAPADSVETALLAESLAEDASDEALPLIDALKGAQPVEAGTILARLRLRQERTAEAAAALDEALIRYRTDPWALQMMVDRSLDLAVEIATADPVNGKRLYQTLAVPFAVGLAEDRRLRTRVTLAGVLADKALCLDALAPLEPDVPWDRELLDLRVRCYAEAAPARLGAARRDLARFDADAIAPAAEEPGGP